MAPLAYRCSALRFQLPFCVPHRQVCVSADDPCGTAAQH